MCLDRSGGRFAILGGGGVGGLASQRSFGHHAVGACVAPYTTTARQACRCVVVGVGVDKWERLLFGAARRLNENNVGRN